MYRNLERRHGWLGLELMDWLAYGIFVSLLFFLTSSLLVRLGVAVVVLVAWRKFKKGRRELFTLHVLRFYLAPRQLSALDRERQGRAYRPSP